MKRVHKHSERERVAVPYSGSHWQVSEGEQDPGALASPGEPGTKRAALGSLLIQSGIATKSQVKEAVNEGLQTGERLGEVAVRRGWATQEQIAILLADQWQLRYLGTEALAVDLAALRLLPIAAVRELDAVPIGFDERWWQWPSRASRSVRCRPGADWPDVSSPWSAPPALDLLLGSRMLEDAPAEMWTSAPHPRRSPGRTSRNRSSRSRSSRGSMTEADEASARATGEGESAVPSADEPAEALDEDREPGAGGAERRRRSPRPKPPRPLSRSVRSAPASSSVVSSPTRPAAVALAAALEESRTALQRLQTACRRWSTRSRRPTSSSAN